MVDRRFGDFYAALPPSTSEVVVGPNANQKCEYNVVTLLHKICKQNTENISEEIKWPFIMRGFRRRSRAKCVKKKKLLSLKERRELGLYKLRRNGMKYRDFLPLHNLWQEYFIDYIDFPSLEEQNFTGSPNDRQLGNVSLKLMKADYHGAILCVKKSICSSLVGKKGIVVFDTKNTFQLLDEDDVLRIIPKESSVFTLKVRDLTFTILGNQFCIKSSMRNSKKIKGCISMDL
ncbi:hypothetical protein R5R35_003807 [Gryllus longicercus]|uniref:Ribonuclease P protein subunit p29 n=1 Tax=Gryllus longicercus TaxID=2509291 RepID=A0AAN9VN77_9ORTH